MIATLPAGTTVPPAPPVQESQTQRRARAYLQEIQEHGWSLAQAARAHHLTRQRMHQILATIGQRPAGGRSSCIACGERIDPSPRQATRRYCRDQACRNARGAAKMRAYRQRGATGQERAASALPEAAG